LSLILSLGTLGITKPVLSEPASLSRTVDVRLSDGYAEVNGIRLHFVSGGSGPTILLIPSWVQTWYAWRGVIPRLLDAGYRVVAVDPRGMGQSSWPEQGYDTGQLGEDLHGLMKSLDVSRYTVVGHDIGMWIAYAMAADHPEAVERLAIVEAVIPGLLDNPPDIFMPRAQSAFFWQFLFNQQPDLPETLLEGREQQLLSYLFSKWAYSPERIAVDVYATTYSGPGAVRAQMGYYRAFPETIEQNRRRATHKLPMPVLALGGDHAVGDFIEVMMRPVALKLQGGTLVNCGHFAPEECPEALTDRLLPFLSGQ
jgi:pimeloyl-ACP methyl ester carboxylesterase